MVRVDVLGEAVPLVVAPVFVFEVVFVVVPVIVVPVVVGVMTPVP